MENQSFPVPKSLFINICNLKKKKNRVQASVALEADLCASDIDICVVSETHLNNKIPDSVVAMASYNLYRRDRDYNADTRKNGGMQYIFDRTWK